MLSLPPREERKDIKKLGGKESKEAKNNGEQAGKGTIAAWLTKEKVPLNTYRDYQVI